MKIKRFPYDDFAIHQPASALTASLRALYRRRDVSLDSVSISVRHAGVISYLDAKSAADVLLELAEAQSWATEHREETGLEPPAGLMPVAAVHGSAYALFDDIHAVITGRPPSTMALLELGASLGRPTSMMQKRNVNRADTHVVNEEIIDATNAERLLRDARLRADDAEMGHMLIIIPKWGVLCAAPNLAEAVAHFDAVEVVARAEAARLTATRRQGIGGTDE